MRRRTERAIRMTLKFLLKQNPEIKSVRITRGSEHIQHYVIVAEVYSHNNPVTLLEPK